MLKKDNEKSGSHTMMVTTCPMPIGEAKVIDIM